MICLKSGLPQNSAMELKTVKKNDYGPCGCYAAWM